MMEDVKKWHEDTVVEKTLSSLEKNGFKTKELSNREEALQWLLSTIPPNAEVGVGGSVTLREIGVVKALEERGNVVYQHWKKGLSPKEREEIRKKQLTSDVFLTSSNAVTEEGELVNVDGGGNRVAAMIYGPGQIIVVIGMNKITEDLEDALNRVMNVAAPMNCKRLGRKTPCAETGRCEDCDVPDRICNITTIIERSPSISDVIVLVVRESLGF